MICLIRNDHNEKLCILNVGSHTVEFDGVDLLLEVNTARHVCGNQYQVSYFNEDIGFACFKKYKLQQEITLGSNAMAHIQINDTNICQVNSIIDVKKMEISNKGKNKVFVNKRNSEFYKPFDVLTINQIKIIITPSFIMVNQPQCIQVNLEPYVLQKWTTSLMKNYPVLLTEQRKSGVAPLLEIHLSQFDQITKTDRQPLFFTLFPILVMSLASLLTGLIMAYQGYMQGRELYEIAPTLILPCVMLLSGVLVHPMQRIYENKKQKRKVEARNQEIDTYVASIEVEIEEYEKKMVNYESMCYFSSKSYTQSLASKEMIFMSKQNTDSDFLKIPLGLGRIDSLIVYKNVPDKRDNYYYTSVLRLIYKYKHFDNHWVILDLNQTQKIYTNHNLVLSWLLFNLLVQYDHKHIQLSIIATSKWLEEYYFLYVYPHVRVDDDLCLYTSLAMYKANNVKRNDKKRIILNLSCEELNCEKNDSVISLIHNEVIPTNSDCFITYSNQQITMKRSDKCDVHCVLHEQDFTIKNLLKDLSASVAFNQHFYADHSLHTVDHQKVLSSKRIENNWNVNKSYHSLKACVGRDDTGHDYFLDLSERKHGPHMLIASTTGGGKTEAIITILTSLATSYSSDSVQFVIVDFKGGGLAQSLKEKNVHLPHLVGSISNLDEHEIERFFYSLTKETKRRQNLFNRASTITGITSMGIDKYQRIADTNTDVEKMAHLFIVVDEFAELKTSYPDYMIELVRCSRIGRSLGLHLILSTQKPANVVDGQIWANCRTKICLKVQDKQDSMEMIGNQEAFFLKKPGEFFQLTDTELYRGTFHYMNSRIKEVDEFKMRVMNFNKVYKELKPSESKNTVLSITIENILNVATSKKKELWCNPLSKMDSHCCIEHRKSIGMIDDIVNSEQYPLILHPKSNVLCIAKNKEGIHTVVTTYMYSSTISFEGEFELFIMDESAQFKSYSKKSNFIHSVDTDELVCNLIRHIQNRTKTERHLKLLVLNTVTFLEKCNNLDVDIRKFLNLGLQNNYSMMLFGLVTSAIPYSCWNYFDTRMAFEVTNPQELSTLFERTVKQRPIQPGCGYIMQETMLFFKLALIQLSELEQSHCGIEVQKLKLNQMPHHIKAKNRGDIGISFETYLMLNTSDYSPLILLSKYQYKFEEFIQLMNCSKDILCDEQSILNSKEGVIVCESVLVSDEQRLKKHLERIEHSFVICIESSKWESSWVKRLGEKGLILWIGEGFREQYILSNQERMDCLNTEGIWYHKGRKEKFKLINECNGSRYPNCSTEYEVDC